MAQRFNPEEYLPLAIFRALTEVRVQRPEAISLQAARRQRRQTLTRDGHLVLVASDHPARMITAYDGDPLYMADRRRFLAGIVRVLSTPGVDGIEVTADILEDLLILDYLLFEGNGSPMLDNKLLIGSVNRGGLLGSAWELDDLPTGFDVASINAMRLDGAKFMFRLDLTDPNCRPTLAAAAAIARECAAAGVPLFLEALCVARHGERLRMVDDPDRMLSLVGVASALGPSSARTWLELPVSPDAPAFAGATALPVLLFSRESAREPDAVVNHYARPAGSEGKVRGVLLGREVIYNAHADPGELAARIGCLWHDEPAVSDSLDRLRPILSSHFVRR